MSPAQAKLGVCIDDLRLPGPEAIQQAARMGYRAIQIGTVASEFEPQRFGETARRHLRRFVNDQNLEIAALLVDIGGIRFGDPARLEEGVDRTVAAIQMAAQMHVPIVAVELGPDRAGRRPRRAVAAPARANLRLHRHVPGPADRLHRSRRDGPDDPYAWGPRPSAPATTRPACCWAASRPSPASDPSPNRSSWPTFATPSPAAAARAAAAARRRDARPPSAKARLDLAEYLAALQEASYFGPLIVRRLHAHDPLAELSKARQQLELLGR